MDYPLEDLLKALEEGLDPESFTGFCTPLTGADMDDSLEDLMKALEDLEGLDPESPTEFWNPLTGEDMDDPLEDLMELEAELEAMAPLEPDPGDFLDPWTGEPWKWLHPWA